MPTMPVIDTLQYLAWNPNCRSLYERASGEPGGIYADPPEVPLMVWVALGAAVVLAMGGGNRAKGKNAKGVA